MLSSTTDLYRRTWTAPCRLYRSGHSSGRALDGSAPDAPRALVEASLATRKNPVR